MSAYRVPVPEPVPENPYQIPDGRDLRPESVLGLGRAVIAMTAVCGRAGHEPVKVTYHCDIRPPTDVMAITSLPVPPANHPVSGLPLSD